MAYALESAGFGVTLAATRDEVTNLLDRQRFDVIVMADGMSAEPAFDMIRRVAHDHETSGLVVLYGGDTPDGFCGSLPVAVVVSKPFSLEALIAAVERVCGPHQQAS